MIEIFYVQDKEEEERQAGSRPYQIPECRIVPFSKSRDKNDRETNDQDDKINSGHHAQSVMRKATG